MAAADPPLVGNRKGAPLQLVQRDFSLSGLFHQPVQLGRQIPHALLVHIPHHRHDQACLGIHGNAEMVVPLEDHLCAGLVQAGVEGGMLFQRRHQRLHDKGGQRQVRPFLFKAGGEFLSERQEIGDIHLVELGDVWNRGPGIVHPLTDRSPERRDPFLLDRAPARKIDPLGRRLLGLLQSRPRGICDPLQMLDVRPQVLKGNPAAALSPLDSGEVDG